ncbi:MAG: PASTA domain-containing protein, partial [Acidobacteriota bacterium]|nr:PASTA domain-containing protein [Acidobacteriota bacterium]
MPRSPMRWLVALGVLSALLTALPPRADARAGQQPTGQLARQVPTTEMPDLVGLSLEAARKQPVVVKFRLALVPEPIESTRARPDTITNQSVPAGRPVRAGTRIVVSVAVGGVAVPPVEGQPIETARERLRELGFGVETSTAPSGRLRPGTVSRQEPKAGTIRPRGSVVQLEVASAISIDPRPSGRPGGDVSPGGPQFAVMPNVVDRDERTALALLKRAGLEGRVRRSRSRGKPGLVIEQTPKEGTRVAPGSTADITVSIPLADDVGKPPDPDQRPDQPPPPPPTQYMPNLVGRTAEEAAADGAVRKLRLRITPRDDPMADGRPGIIVRQSIAASSPVDPGSAVTVWVATGVVVPPLVGLGADAARRTLDAKGLQGRFSEVVRDRDAGTIVEQTPGAGVVVSRGAAVGLSVAVLEMARVPDLVGRDRREAVNLLTASRLTGEFGDDQESALAPGLVSAQNRRPGSQVPVGTAVQVRVASGVVVPSVIGATSREARARITSSGLTVESREVRTDRSAADVVFEQVPGAGQRVARGTNVLLSVAIPSLVTVPDVGRRNRADAVGQLASARLKADVANDVASELAPGLVTSQDPAPGAQVVAGSAVRLMVAVGVEVPSVVG